MSTLTTPRYVQATELVVGANHPTLTDVTNRPLQDMVKQSPFGTTTYNAGSFISIALPAGTPAQNAAVVNAAIAAAVADGATMVFVPRVLMPYTASAVTFNTGVRMVCEGGDPAVFAVRAYGAAGDNATDDSACFVGAVAGASVTGGVVHTVAGTYLTNPIICTASYVKFIFDPGAFLQVQNPVSGTGTIDVRGSETGVTTTTTVDAPLRSTSLTVSNGAGFSVGDVIEIYSAAVGTGGFTPYLIELNVVASTGPTTLGLKRPTRNAYLQSVATCTVTKLNPVRGLEVSGANLLDSNVQGEGIHVSFGIDLHIEGIDVQGGTQTGINLLRCQGGRVVSSTVHDLAGAGDGWTFGARSCQDITFFSCISRDGTWDAFDVSNGTMYCTWTDCKALNFTDGGFVCGHGQFCHHNIFAFCSAIGCGAVGFQWGDPSYQGDNDNLMIGCRAFGITSGDGFKLKNGSTRNRFVDCQSHYNSGAGYTSDTLSVDNEFLNCHAVGNGTHGMSLQARSRIVGGRFDANTSRGIYITTSTASFTTIDGVWCNANGARGIELNNVSDVTIRYPTCDNATGATQDGIFISVNCPRCRVVEPRCNNNTRWGVAIVDSAGDCAGSKVIGGQFSGNASGPVYNNCSPAIAEATLVAGFDPRTLQGGPEGGICEVTLTAARVVGAPTTPMIGQIIRFTFIQGGAGGFAITWNAIFKGYTWSDAGNATGKRSSIAFLYDGSNWNAMSAQAAYA